MKKQLTPEEFVRRGRAIQTALTSTSDREAALTALDELLAEIPVAQKKRGKEHPPLTREQEEYLLNHRKLPPRVRRAWDIMIEAMVKDPKLARAFTIVIQAAMPRLEERQYRSKTEDAAASPSPNEDPRT